MPTALMPHIPSVRKLHSGVRFELGQIQHEPVPTPVYRPLDEPIGEVPHVSMTPRRCPDCSDSFKPRAWNQERCRPCGTAYRLAAGKARKKTSRTRRHEPRMQSASWLKGQATRKVNQATRARAELGATIKRRSAA